MHKNWPHYRSVKNELDLCLFLCGNFFVFWILSNCSTKFALKTAFWHEKSKECQKDWTNIHFFFQSQKSWMKQNKFCVLLCSRNGTSSHLSREKTNKISFFFLVGQTANNNQNCVKNSRIGMSCTVIVR